MSDISSVGKAINHAAAGFITGVADDLAHLPDELRAYAIDAVMARFAAFCSAMGDASETQAWLEGLKANRRGEG